jgi:hypothetical protein
MVDSKFDDLENWFERTGSLTEADRALLEWLRSLSAEAGQPDSGRAADLAYYEIHNAIDKLINQKLRAERKRARKVITQHGTEDQYVRLVRIKAYELGIGQPRRSRQEAERLALQDFKLNERERRVIWKETDFRPVERRAIAILNGAPRIAKKNFQENDAIRIADAVIAEWFRPRGRLGRPVGSRIALARRAIDDPKLASVTEAIEAVLPIIKRLAGPEISSSPRSTMIKAVAAAVESAGLTCTSSLAASIVRVLHRGGRSPSN